MAAIECDKCPIQYHCPTWQIVEKEVDSEKCPLLKTVKEIEEREEVTKMSLEGSYSDACCKEMQEAAQEDFVYWISKDCIYLRTTYQVNDGGGHFDTMTDKDVQLVYCPFCGKKL